MGRLIFLWSIYVDNIKTKEEFNIINTFISSVIINFEAFIQIDGKYSGLSK